MNNSSVFVNNRQLSKAQTAMLFLVCIIAPALIGFFGCYLSKMTASAVMIAPFAPSGKVSSIIWTICNALFGAGFFLALTANANNSERRTVRRWSVSLWSTLFVLGLFLPFFIYKISGFMLSFVWLTIIDAVLAALIAIGFKLRPVSAFLAMPVAFFAILMTCACFYAAINI